MDGGSERSYVTTSLKEKLQLRPIKTEVLNLNTFGNEQHSKKRCELVRVRLHSRDGEDIEIRALTFPAICAPPVSFVDMSHFTILRELDLADDPQTDEDASDTIDILIGSDHYWDIVIGDITREGDGPVAINSRLGWLLSGHTRHSRNHDSNVITNLALVNSIDSSVDEVAIQLQRFWDTEAIGIMECSVTADDHFSSLVEFEELEKRYVVSLPWASLHPTSTNYDICVTRLHMLRARLQRDNSLFQQYQATFDSQLHSGIIELVPEAETTNESCFFLPHHGVVRQDKETTKLRVVFDGSAKSDCGVSLNDCLAKGSNQTPLVFDILIRFRAYQVGLVADIEKAFRQILICKPDRDMLRFLWLTDDGEGQIRVVQYRFCRLPFGLKPSPALLNAVLEKHLARYSELEPDMFKLLAQSFYADDFIGSPASIEEGEEIYVKARRALREGGFNLRKWHTNVSSLQKQMSDTESSQDQVSMYVKVLGALSMINCALCCLRF